jgi:hypothetical protein
MYASISDYIKGNVFISLMKLKHKDNQNTYKYIE